MPNLGSCRRRRHRGDRGLLGRITKGGQLGCVGTCDDALADNIARQTRRSLALSRSEIFENDRLSGGAAHSCEAARPCAGTRHLALLRRLPRLDTRFEARGSQRQGAAQLPRLGRASPAWPPSQFQPHYHHHHHRHSTHTPTHLHTPPPVPRLQSPARRSWRLMCGTSTGPAGTPSWPPYAKRRRA